MEKGRYAERQWLALIASAGRETVGRTTTDNVRCKTAALIMRRRLKKIGSRPEKPDIDASGFLGENHYQCFQNYHESRILRNQE
jgi:hypothetical protein